MGSRRSSSGWGPRIPSACRSPEPRPPASCGGVEYLKEVNATGESPTQGKRVMVIGGGNVAMDVARVARRQGAASVSLIALKSPEELPACPWEVAEAKAEGIEIL